MIGSSIGNFDGVHLGHQALVESLRSTDRELSALVAVTFEPSPEAVLGRPGKARIQTAPERRRQLLKAGFNDVLELSTTPELLSLEPRAFMERLMSMLGGDLAVLAEGADFRFGSGRSGSVETLGRVGESFGFEVEVVAERRVRLADGLEVPARSSVVRRLLELGRVEDVSRMLGRRHELVGTVVKGDQRGRTIGIPTANLDLGGAMLPADGVYAGLATLPDGSRLPAAISVGTKPTFEPTPAVAEVHLLDWDGRLDDYGWMLSATLARRLRGQERYDGLAPFLAQLERDLEATRRVAEMEMKNPIGVQP